MFCSPELRNLAIEIGLKENGTLKGENEERINEYTSAAGVGKGGAWCVSFAYWCFLQAAKELGFERTPMIRTGSCGKLYKWADAHNLLVDSPMKGDLYITKKKSHTGMIAVANPAFKTTKTNTIEGNTYRVPGKWGVHKRKKSLEEAFFVRI
ncbi:MAG: hypothetical protein DWQ47_10480 [Acidobacteria bacterium]|nr:MAG: hypothetical protein DWQ32_12895 [Acidobacteriota bacterium]REJ98011.1 MAG: hypothetical protein DWQ38_15695 [Acidobacteriota bacterium]REK16754.1 MAG: hypothetical protein DWQ43_00740 [Acidobacteriota bacterium]REK42665.1 MAG: hypothetical protein DWQ47_10480 [Acidobacteriota bacterium]